MTHLRTAVRLALRNLRRRPGFAVVVVSILALAIAGNATMFAVADAALVDPLPFREAGRLATIDVVSPQGFAISTSIPNYRDWRDGNRFAEAWSGEAGRDLRLTGEGRPAEVLAGRLVLGDLFGALGLAPRIGRTFSATETELGAEPVVVLGHDFWQRRFGGDTSVVGRAIVLDDRPFVVIGVLRPGEGYPDRNVDAYVPMGAFPDLAWDLRGSSFGTRSVVRLRPAITMAEAQRDLDRLHREIETREGQAVARPEIRSLEDFYVGKSRPRLWLLLCAVGCVLLVAVANVTHLFLVRGEGQRGEIAVRRALGAPRWALAAPALAEGVVLASLGGVAGIGLAAGILRAGAPLLVAGLPTTVTERIGLDLRVVAITLLLTVGAGLVAGIAPALGRVPQDLASRLRERSAAGGASGRRPVRSALVVAEVATSVVLLVGAGLLLSSLEALRRVDLGFRPDGVLAARVMIPENRDAEVGSWSAFYQEVETAVDALPGVESAAVSLLVPLTGYDWELEVWPRGADLEAPGSGSSTLFNVVSAGYFETMGMPILRGRGFTTADRNDADPVAIVDETTIARFWPGEEGVGRRIHLDEWDGERPIYRTIVGVVPNLRHYVVAEPSRIQTYVPVTQTLDRHGLTLTLLARGDVPPETLGPAIAAAVGRVDPAAPTFDVTPLPRIVDGALASTRTVSLLLAAFSGLALLLAALGLFGLLSWMVVQRLREIGIRMALGADGGRIVGWISGRALLLTGTGVALGLVAAALASRFVRGFLFGVAPLSPVHYGGAAAVLLAVAALAVALPARRAVGVSPTMVLRQDG